MYIPNAHGQAYLYGISEMSMNTPSAKKRKNLKNKKKILEKFEKKELIPYECENGAYSYGIHTHIISSMQMADYLVQHCATPV
jgi:hypothetical protein